MVDNKIFVSGVSCEFREVRNLISNRLPNRFQGYQCWVQEMFRPESGTTIEKLYNYISRSSRVFCLIGKHSGAFPSAADLEQLKQRMPGLLPSGITTASYTQLEFWIARVLGLDIHIFLASEDAELQREDPPPGDDPQQQRQFLAAIKSIGLDRPRFKNPEALLNRIYELDLPTIALPDFQQFVEPNYYGNLKYQEQLEHRARQFGEQSIVETELGMLEEQGAMRVGLENLESRQSQSLSRELRRVFLRGQSQVVEELRRIYPADNFDDATYVARRIDDHFESFLQLNFWLMH